MNRPDPIAILVLNQRDALIAHGVSPEQAAAEAEARVAKVLDELNHLGLADVYVGVALRRALVYRLRSAGATVANVCERLGIGPTQEYMDYRAEMARRRLLSNLQQ